MGRIVICVFKPKPGKDAELRQVIADRLPLLRSLGLATEREQITMRARNGEIVDVSEWVDEAAIHRAHETPEVHALWARFEACCEYMRLNTLPEADEMFAGFEAI